MAVTRRNPTGAVDLYGLSGDTKPTTFGVGSHFTETDTGVVYIWSGSAWFQTGMGGGRNHLEDSVLTDAGEIAGAATATVMPTVVAKFVRFKARSDNAGSVYIGLVDATKPDGTTDATTGFELVAGDDTGWIPTTNLNVFYRICDNAGDDLTYLVLA